MPDKKDKRDLPTADSEDQAQQEPSTRKTMNTGPGIAQIMRQEIGAQIDEQCTMTIVVWDGDEFRISSEGTEAHVEQMIEALYRELQENRAEQSAHERARLGRLCH
jgi:hypothetical protein